MSAEASVAPIRARLGRLDDAVKDDPDPRALVVVYLIQAAQRLLDHLEVSLIIRSPAEATRLLHDIDSWVADAEATIA